MFTQLDNFLKAGNDKKIQWLVIGLLLLLGIHNRFIQDDAFISFRYAKHLIDGYGLTWNIGEQEPVEGYTNFLWVLLLAAGMALKIQPETWSMVLGLLFASGSLYVTHQLARMLLESRVMALVTIILLGTNYSFSSYMTGGLETQLQTFLVITAVYLTFLVRDKKVQVGFLSLVALSLLFALSVMTRLDSVLICGPLYLFLTTDLLKIKSPGKSGVVLALVLTIPGLLMVGLWFLFKISYYGDILPNTFYLKASGISLETFQRGALYTWLFLISYSLVIFILLGCLYIQELFAQLRLRMILIILGLWVLYIIKIGGDFMEYRYFVPVLPLIFLIVSSVLQQIHNARVQISFVALMIFSSLNHAATFSLVEGIESISSLNAHIDKKSENWKGVGTILGKLFSPSEEPVTIATRAAGAIPYFSELRTIDMLGVNDKWIARHGTVLSTRPGHVRITTLEYLLQSNVNLVSPKVISISVSAETEFSSYLRSPVPSDITLLPAGSRIIEIPLDDQYKIEALYLVQHVYIDETIKRLGLKTYQVAR